MTLKEIQKIIKDFENSELTELELEYKEVKLKLSKNKITEAIKITDINNNHIEENIESIVPKINLQEEEIKSPLVGTFYAAGSPDAKPFVSIGDTIKKGDTVCIIEAMKIMNEITATHDGVIDVIHFENGDAVGFDDLLFTVKKHGK